MKAEIRRGAEGTRPQAAASVRSARASLLYLGIGAVAIAIFFVLPSSWQNFAFDTIALSGVVAIMVGVLRNRPENPSAWYAMAVGQLLFVVGDVIWTYLEEVRHQEAPFPSVADAAYLAGYVPLGIGLLLVVRARRPGRDLASIVDAAIVTVAAAVGSWVFLIAPQIGDGTGVEPWVTAAYPAADVLLIAVAASVAFSADTRVFSYRLIAISLLGLIVSDVAYMVGEMHGWYATGSIVDLGWLLSYVAWGAAALHPSMRKLTEPNRTSDSPRFTQRRLVTEAIAVFAIPAMWTIQMVRGAPRHSGVVVVGSTLASILVIARMRGLVSALQAAALHDPLTGLPNRRLLLDRIGQAFRRAERAGTPIAVLFLDLGGFKNVNDRFGHDAGDDALIEIGQRIQGVVRGSDTVARLGGDEFVVVCEGLAEPQAHALARRVRRTVSTPIEIGGELVELTVDLGVAVESAPAESDARYLLVAADRAMYHAKQAAKESSSASPFSD